MKIDANLPRRESDRVPRAVALRALQSPRMSGKSRRLFMRALGQIIEVPRKEPAEPQVTFCAKLRRLSIRQLDRQLTKNRRKLRQAERLLDGLQLDSFRKLLTEQIAWLKYQAGWITQEAESRVYLREETIDATGN